MLPAYYPGAFLLQEKADTKRNKARKNEKERDLKNVSRSYTFTFL